MQTREQSDKSLGIRTVFVAMTGRRAHVFTIVLVGHLLIEHVLEQIILAKAKGHKNLLKLTFSEKLKELYPTYLPLNIFRNIKRLNDIRNELVHNLRYTSYEPIVYGPRREKLVIKTPRGQDARKYYLSELTEQVLFELVNYASDTLEVSIDAKRLLRDKMS